MRYPIVRPPLPLLLLLLLLLFSSPTTAGHLEHPYIHKPPRIMASGGADVAVGGHPDALFSNPAGLAAMPPGWHLEPVRVSLATAERTRRFLRRLESHLDLEDSDEQRDALIDLVETYQGRNLHAQASFLPSLSYRDTEWAVSLAWIESLAFDGKTRQGFGHEGLVDVHARTLSGPMLGLAREEGPWRIGASLKHLRRDSLHRTYSVREIVDISASDEHSFSDDFEEGRGTALDLGLQYQLPPEYPWRPQAGLAIMNLGGLDFGRAGKIPQSVNLGLAVHPPTPGRTKVTLSADYWDALHQAGTDNDHLKRLRLGAHWQLWDQKRSALGLRAGLYQGAPTAGADLRLSVVRIGLATWAEEQGAYAGQERERRHALTLGIGF